MEVSKAISAGVISITDANNVLYGDSPNAWQRKCSQYTLEQIDGLLSSLGLLVVKRRLNGLYFIVEGVRE
jgi:hypothetical protein